MGAGEWSVIGRGAFRRDAGRSTEIARTCGVRDRADRSTTDSTDYTDEFQSAPTLKIICVIRVIRGSLIHPGFDRAIRGRGKKRCNAGARSYFERLQNLWPILPTSIPKTSPAPFTS